MRVIFYLRCLRFRIREVGVVEGGSGGEVVWEDLVRISIVFCDVGGEWKDDFYWVVKGFIGVFFVLG